MKNAAQVAVSEKVSVCLSRDGSIQITPVSDTPQQKEEAKDTLTKRLEVHGREA